MKKYIEKQYSLHYRISRTTENMKKLGASKITKGVVTARIETLEKYWTAFQQAHDELLDICEEKEKALPYFTEDYLTLTEECYLQEKSTLLDYLDKLSPSKKTESVETENRRNLPRIELPSFTGDYHAWTNFRDLFKSIILDNSSLTNVERLHYLKTSVKGEPALLLQNITVTNDNFERAWNLIVNRYENQRLIINSQLAALMALPKISRESAEDLKHLLNSTSDAIQALEALGRPVKYWGDWFVFITVQRLDGKTRMSWETSIGASTEPSTFGQLRDFLESRVRALEAVEQVSCPPTPASSSGRVKATDQSRNSTRIPTGSLKVHMSNRATGAAVKCPLCGQAHFILFCSLYKSKTPQERKQLVVEKNLCYNCLNSHAVKFCNSNKRCQICLGKHHTSLHTTGDLQNHNTASSAPTSSQVTRNTMCCQVKNTSSTSILLATAIVKLSSNTGAEIRARALIDPCSEVTLISERLVQLLKLPKRSMNIPIAGVANMQKSSRGLVTCRLSSLVNHSFSCVINAFVLPKLTSYSTPKTAIATDLSHLADLELADPQFLTENRIDILLGADVYAQLILDGLRKGPNNAPIAQHNELGWILTGPVALSRLESTSKPPSSLHCSSTVDLGEYLQRFWRQEEVSASSPSLTEEEAACENHFITTHTRDETGRYVVRLPFTKSPAKLGNSRVAAQGSLEGMERRFTKDEHLSEAYIKFMREYTSLEHMNLVNKEVEVPRSRYVHYLPHHGVWKESSTTTKLRVVFNGSRKTTSGYSLNDLLHKGPNLLPDITSLLIRWRLHSVVFSADIEKMYRQIRIHPDDADLQRILWRESPSQPISEYQLLTVTYGLACAPFLAIRTLQQLAVDERDSFPLGASVLKHDVYVDDVISGADSVEEAKGLQDELIFLLKAGGFNLRKWCSNDPGLIEHLPSDLRATRPDVACEFEDVFSLLGLRWDANTDCFLFSFNETQVCDTLTKRNVFSEIARLFDPLGFLAPVVVTAKIFLQSLWLLHLSWDEPLPPQYQQFWKNYREELLAISQLRIPRWVSFRQSQDTYQLHGFCDASEKAYAAVVYLRTVCNNAPKVHFLFAKTRVAPLKQISLPRLEMCAASLLVRLVKYLQEKTSLSKAVTHLWCDSTIVLSWLQGHPSRWKTFVANRVSEIQLSVPDAHWHHISSKDNPADCASRGLIGRQLVDHSSWRYGPEFLHKEDWVDSKTQIVETNLEAKAPVFAHVISKKSEGDSWDLPERYSSFCQLLRITAWILRFCKNTRQKVRTISSSQEPYLTAEELASARLILLKLVQRAAFPTEINILSSGSPLTKETPLLRLTPFLDSDGLLRVGSRLKHSVLSPEEKHPIILPQRGHFIQLLIKDCHEKTLHGGTQLTLSTLRQRFWILCGRKVVRNYIRRCITCFRWRAQPSHQITGNLPTLRVTPSRPFLHSGVDYAGPFAVKTTPGRGYKTKKGYVVVFVCLATRAVHLELVSDYTTEAFLAAYRRFTSRRGNCATILSDCGTNLVGAAKELRRLLSTASKEMKQMAQFMATDGTSWRFNPPGAPHFGGIWEAAVKSFKFHLRRVVGDTPLTFEEFTTVLAQIEACLNSRPLTPLSDDPTDFEALTAGHFLIGAPLTSFPEPSLTKEIPNRLSRWQLLSAMREHFWQRWATEYLHTLHARHKWMTATPNVKVGDLCLIRNELCPPTKWPLARIEAVHSGDDGKIRVVTLRTSSSLLQRPITKVCILPQQERGQEESNTHP